MGNKKSKPIANDGYALGFPFKNTSDEEFLSKDELVEGVVVLMSFGSKLSQGSQLSTDRYMNRVASARAEADRIAEEEALRLTTEQAIRVNEDEISRTASITQISMSSQVSIRSIDNYDNLEESDQEEVEKGFMDRLSLNCNKMFLNCKDPKIRIITDKKEFKRRINSALPENCNVDFAIDQTVDKCSCLGPHHDRSTCRICRGMHLEDAPLLY